MKLLIFLCLCYILLCDAKDVLSKARNNDEEDPTSKTIMRNKRLCGTPGNHCDEGSECCPGLECDKSKTCKWGTSANNADGCKCEKTQKTRVYYFYIEYFSTYNEFCLRDNYQDTNQSFTNCIMRTKSVQDCKRRYACPFNVTNCETKYCVAASGVPKTFIAVNRQLPSPTICACVNDTINVNVFNSFQDNAITIHWHGMFQRGTPQMDGTPYVSQCPLPGTQSFNYTFKAFPAGTHWYHSHMSLQRYDGLQGPLIVKERQNRTDVHYDYDEPLKHTLFVQDWVNDKMSMAQLMKLDYKYGSSVGHDKPRSLLINGKGFIRGKQFVLGNENYHTPPSIFKVEKGKKYRFRVIQATSTASPFLVYIPGHKMTIIASDSIPLSPVKDIDLLELFTGERYDFILSISKNDTFPIPIYIIASNDLSTKKSDNITTIPVFQMAYLQNSTKVNLVGNKTDEIRFYRDFCRYLARPQQLKIFNPAKLTVTENLKMACLPIVICMNISTIKLMDTTMPNATTLPDSFKEIAREKFSGIPDQNISIELSSLGNDKAFDQFRFQMNNISWNFPSHPPLFTDDPTEFCNESTIKNNFTKAIYNRNNKPWYFCPHNVYLDYNKLIEIVLTSVNNSIELHPIHLHGHSYAVVAQGFSSPNMSTEEFMRLDREGKITRNLKNPIRKDTIGVPHLGYAVIRLQANNPGLWFFHCHYDFHSHNGMMMTLYTKNPTFLDEYRPKNWNETQRCGSWQTLQTEIFELALNESAFINGAKDSKVNESNLELPTDNLFSHDQSAMSPYVLALMTNETQLETQ